MLCVTTLNVFLLLQGLSAAGSSPPTSRPGLESGSEDGLGEQ